MSDHSDPAWHVHTCLDRCLSDSRPFALGYSGGGDSHALLCLAADWAKARASRLYALIVDHGLRPESRTEAEAAAASARRLGAEPVILNWTGEKPVSGISAAARNARHSLLAEACRGLGIEHLLLAHTLDDQNETVLMRLQAGGGWRGCAGMSEVSVSPIWPEGRGIALVRPLLGVRRQALRDYLVARGETWIDDPSNLDRHYARIRARQSLERMEAAGLQPGRFAALARELMAISRAERQAAAAFGQDAVHFHDWGGAELDARRLTQAEPVIRRRILAAAAMAVSGNRAPASGAALDQLAARLVAGRSGTAAGVQILQWRGSSWMIRDPGAVLGRVDHAVANAVALPVGRAMVWDGRYEIETSTRNIIAEPLGAAYTGLDDKSGLEAVPGQARAGLLSLRRDGEVLAVPGVRAHADVRIAPLMEHRYCTRLAQRAPAEPLRAEPMAV